MSERFDRCFGKAQLVADVAADTCAWCRMGKAFAVADVSP